MTSTPKPTQPQANSGRDDNPNGQRDKFAWIYAVLADSEVSHSAARMAVAAAFKKAGRKGFLKASRKELGQLSGQTARNAQRGINELAEKNYWAIESSTGGASTYTLIPPDARLQIWLDAERKYKRDYELWLHEENNHKYRCDKWLDAENKYHWIMAEREARTQFKDAVSVAVICRGGDPTIAGRVAAIAWRDHTEGKVTLDEALKMIDGAPAERFQPEPDLAQVGTASVTGGVTDCHGGCDNAVTPGVTDCHGVCDTPNAVTSGNDDSHKYLKGSGKTPKGSCKNQKCSPAPLASSARSACEPDSGEPSDGDQHQQDPMAAGCQLCDSDGFMVGNYRHRPVVTLEDYATDRSMPVMCTHSMADNISIIRQVTASGEWVLDSMTGYHEIDRHFIPKDVLEEAYDSNGAWVL